MEDFLMQKKNWHIFMFSSILLWLTHNSQLKNMIVTAFVVIFGMYHFSITRLPLLLNIIFALRRKSGRGCKKILQWQLSSLTGTKTKLFRK